MSLVKDMYKIVALNELIEKLKDDLHLTMDDIYDESKYYQDYQFETIDEDHVFFNARSYAGCGTYDHHRFRVTHAQFYSLIQGTLNLNGKEKLFEI